MLGFISATKKSSHRTERLLKKEGGGAICSFFLTLLNQDVLKEEVTQRETLVAAATNPDKAAEDSRTSRFDELHRQN